MNIKSVWIVDDDSAIRWVLERALTQAGYHCNTFESGALVLEALEQQQPDVLISDIRMPGIDGLSLISHVKQKAATLPVIIMTAHSDLDAAVSAYQHGAFEYLPKPFDLDDALQLVERAIAHNQEQKNNEKPVETRSIKDSLIGEAPAMQDVFRVIGRLSNSSMSVLIQGESGTGKELIAKALHQHSPRKEAPFIALNMAAIPKDLIESELFGHEKGAFTGANTLRQGRFEQANNGTLFLDEIGDMPLEVQTRLLRVLAEGQFYRVGGATPIKVDVRIIAATHQNLLQRVEKGDFREDLYHRINVIKIALPPLRERVEDIPQLAIHFLNLAAQELGVAPKTWHNQTLEQLKRAPWPGNVRQLENSCRWLMAMVVGQEILPQDLPKELQANQHIETDNNPTSSWQALLSQKIREALQQGEKDIAPRTLDEVEKMLIEQALQHFSGHKQQAALQLGYGRNTLTRKLKTLDIKSE